MLRSILFLHRWLGIVVGLMMTVWCLSGFVMMYSDYPRLMPEEQLRGLAPLQLPDAQALERADIPADTALSSVRLEMMAERPVLRISPAVPHQREIAQMRAVPENFDLATGQEVAVAAPGAALEIARSFATRSEMDQPLQTAIPVEMDQWTVQTARRHQPLHRVDFPSGETIYVAGSGEVVQQTTRSERILGWLGAVPHWLYPTLLRQNGALWTQVVIWTAVVGCFLTATGLWVGIARLKRRRDGAIGSPFRGIWWWHHMTGLFFGLLTLSWVASGLLTMSPWGLLDSIAGFEESDRLKGKPLVWGDVRDALEKLETLPPGTVRVETAPLSGRVFLAAIPAEGRPVRLNSQGEPAPLTRNELAEALSNGPSVASLELLEEEDTYYYSHKFPITLPIWSAVLADRDNTRLYIDPQTGRLLRAYDNNGRISRWLRNGLHSFDFAYLRTRPIWDLVVLPLLAIVTFVCGTGTWMGFQKISRDWRRTKNRRRRRKQAWPATSRSAGSISAGPPPSS